MGLPEDDEFEPTLLIRRDRSPDLSSLDDVLGHYLVVVSGQEPGRRVEIGPAPVTIGRDPRQTLVFPGTDVSRLHARVSLVGGDVVVEDMGSTNGTFVDADRVTGQVPLREGTVLRLGQQVLKYERRSRRDVARTEELARDLLTASSYVHSLLPPPLTDGPVRTEWRFLPSAELGGDAFGYYWLEPHLFVLYLIDVSGHGVGAAMHSVAVLNLLRQRALPGVDFRHPSEVLASLNARFQMDSHDGMYFTTWYGVFDTRTRVLTYGTAGLHPAYIVAPDRAASHPAGMSALMIGAFPDVRYESAQTHIPPGARLYLFSDGVFEIVTPQQEQWSIDNFLPLLLEPAIPGTSEPDRLYQAIRQVVGPGPLADDFSLVVVTFP